MKHETKDFLVQFRADVLSYRTYVQNNHMSASEARNIALRIFLSTVRALLSGYGPVNESDRESVLMRLDRVAVLMQIDTPEESFDFLVHELTYSWWICHILGLPTDKEEREEEIASESDH